MEIESEDHEVEASHACSSDEEKVSLLEVDVKIPKKVAQVPSKTPRIYIVSCVVVVIIMIIVGWFQFSGGRDTDPDEEFHEYTPPQAAKLPRTSPTNIRFPEPYGPYPWNLVVYRHKLNATLGDIWNRWEVDDYPKFLNMMNIPSESWDIQKNKFIKLVIDNFEPLKNISLYTVGSHSGGSKVRPRPTKKTDYIVGFSGSSVTAGHDSFFSESFPFVFERRIAPLFATIFNATVVTRNHALGNNPCYPYDACVATHMGTDVDLLAWEQVSTPLLLIFTYSK